MSWHGVQVLFATVFGIVLLGDSLSLLSLLGSLLIVGGVVLANMSRASSPAVTNADHKFKGAQHSAMHGHFSSGQHIRALEGRLGPVGGADAQSDPLEKGEVVVELHAVPREPHASRGAAQPSD